MSSIPSKPTPPPQTAAQVQGAANPDIVHHKSARRKRKEVGPTRMDLNLTSMIDVVFQLLLYFIITASFTEGEGVITANFPTGSGGAPDPLKLEQPIKIIVSSKGQTGYRIGVDKSPTDPSTFGDLHKMLEGMQEANGGFFKDDNPVIIQPSADVRWQHVVNAFNAAIRARFKNIAFAQHGGGDGG